MIAELRYDLTRKQRLIPHIRLWGAAQLIVIIGGVTVVFSAMEGSWLFASFLFLLVFWFGRGYIFGLLNVLFVRSHHMDIHIEDNGLGYMAGKERWYIHLDGLTAVRNLERSVWTIQHHNGAVVNIPKNILSDDALEFLRNWVHRANEIRTKHKIRSPFPS